MREYCKGVLVGSSFLLVISGILRSEPLFRASLLVAGIMVVGFAVCWREAK